jgi:ligand-binding sensor domain-containing protein/signal transduction histidine kinase
MSESRAQGLRMLRRAGGKVAHTMSFRIKLFAFGCVLAFVMPLSALPPGKQLQQYGHQTWQSDSGLPQNTVNAVIQTRDGFIWLATEGGLVRFDGTDFLVFNVENSPALRSNSVHSLMEDGAGTLWVGTAAGLVSVQGGKFRRYGTEQGLASDSVLSCYAMAGGGVVAVTAGGIAVLRGDKFEAVPGAGNLSLSENAGQFAQRGRVWIAGGQQVLEIDLASGGSIRTSTVTDVGELQAVAVSASGELWVGGSRGAEKLAGEKRARYSQADGLPAADVTALRPEATGGMWIGTTAGLAQFTDGHVKAIGKQQGLGGASIENLFIDRAGTLWVGSRKGIARVTGDQEVMTLERPWLAGVLAMLEDREGNMWFGTDTAGVSILRNQAFFTLTTQDGLSADFVRTIFQDHAGNVWLGTNGGLDKFAPGAAIAAHDPSRLSSNLVLSLAENGDGLWVGTPAGLERIHGGEAKAFGAADGLADDFVRSLYADQDGSLWIGTRHGLSHFTHGKFTSYSTMDGLGSDLIGAMLRTRKGELWVGTLGGLSRLSGERFVNYAMKSGTDASASEAVTTLLEDANGNLWVGTHGGGLFRVRDGVIARLASSATELPETIYGMLEDGRGNLWLSAPSGVYRVSLAELNNFVDKKSTVVRPTRFGVANGMRTSEASGGGHPAAWRMKDGTLWFATLSGAAVVNPASTLRNTVPPETVIEQVLVDDQPVEFDSASASAEITIRPGSHRVAIRYAGLSFVAPQQVEYRYMLEGFDRGLIEAGGRRTAYYTNLPPGSYKFLVMSANNDGVWSNQPAHLGLKIKPYFVQTGWFYALVGLAVLLVGYAIYRWRVLYVESKYQAVLTERGRIAREIHDTLAQGYVAVSVQLELATRLLKTSSEAALGPLEKSKELVRDGLAEARSSIWNLRSPGDAETLPALLAGMTERGNREAIADEALKAGAVIKLEVKGTYRPLPRAVEAQLLRIAQEAVANSKKHAAAAHIWIALSYDKEQLRLRIADDGAGFTDERSRFVSQGHFGLQGMQERADAIGARLKIESGKDETVNSGTVVAVELSLRESLRKSKG